MESLEERIRRVSSEAISLVEYDPVWPTRFADEECRLRAYLPAGIIVRIDHVGSTAVPGLSAKPIVDMLVEVTSLARVQDEVVPVLESFGYEYFWRPMSGSSTGPYYAWFIKRDPVTGARTHHIHMMEAGFVEILNWLLFRDSLIAHPDLACEYKKLKQTLAERYPNDRERYTLGKATFIARVLERARQEKSLSNRAKT